MAYIIHEHCFLCQAKIQPLRKFLPLRRNYSPMRLSKKYKQSKCNLSVCPRVEMDNLEWGFTTLPKRRILYVSASFLGLAFQRSEVIDNPI
jgi:hypothetical protein